jgi:hypothetical protein
LPLDAFDHYAGLAIRVQKWLRGGDEMDEMIDQMEDMLRKQ